MRDICTELECCGRCAGTWRRRRAAMDAMHARLTVLSAWIAGAALLASAGRIALLPWTG